MQFHNGTGVRTVMGKVGQIDNGQFFRLVILASLRAGLILIIVRSEHEQVRRDLALIFVCSRHSKLQDAAYITAPELWDIC